MRILLDECVPPKLKKHLAGHDVRTVREMGWKGKRNGELLRLMLASNIKVLLTVDKNLQYQQNIRASGVAVVVLMAKTIKAVDLIALVPDVLGKLTSVRPGDLVEIYPVPPSAP